MDERTHSAPTQLQHPASKHLMVVTSCSVAWLLLLAMGLWASTADARTVRGSAEIDGLIQALKGGDRGSQNRAVQRLFHLQHPRGNAAVMKMAQASDTRLRLRGLWALAIVRPPGAGKLLVKASRDNLPAVRLAAVRGLGLLRHGKGLRALRARLWDRGPGVSRETLRALSRYGNPALRLLSQATRRGPIASRLLAVAAIGGVEGKRAIQMLVRLARSSRSPLLRLQAARELQRRRDPRGARALAVLLNSCRQRDIRLQAARQLAAELTARGIALARSALQNASRRGDPQLRKEVASALATLEGRGGSVTTP